MLEAPALERTSPITVPGAYLDRIDLQKPVDPKKPRKHLWLASTNEVLSIGMVIDRGRAVIASLDQPHIVGVDPQEVKISVSDFMDPKDAEAIAQESIRQWIIGKVGQSKVYATQIPIESIQKDIPLVQDIRKKRPQEIIRRVQQSAIPLHVYAALYNAASQGIVYRYVRG